MRFLILALFCLGLTPASAATMDYKYKLKFQTDEYNRVEYTECERYRADPSEIDCYTRRLPTVSRADNAFGFDGFYAHLVKGDVADLSFSIEPPTGLAGEHMVLSCSFAGTNCIGARYTVPLGASGDWTHNSGGVGDGNGWPSGDFHLSGNFSPGGVVRLALVNDNLVGTNNGGLCDEIVDLDCSPPTARHYAAYFKVRQSLCPPA